jgi:hypothetical protein
MLEFTVIRMTTQYETGSPLYSSMYNLDYTYQYDKLSCVRRMYFAHVTLAYLVTLCGLMCFVCRLVPSIMWLHAHFGRAYIILMMWLMATSLVLHNTGLPIAVLISFVCVLGGITLGWLCIKWHQAQMEAMVFEKLSGRIFSSNAFYETRKKISAMKSWSERLFSSKAAHGMFMFVSFVNIFGRLGASDQSGDFVCYTYPVYKQLDSAKFSGANQSLTLVPPHDPNYSKLPWASSDTYWGLELSIGPLAAAVVVGAVFSVYSSRQKFMLQSPGIVMPKISLGFPN